MKLLAPLTVVHVVAAVHLLRSNVYHSVAFEGARAVSQVVTLLEDMLKKSRTEGKEERDLYADFKCYCDDNEKSNTETLATAEKNIALLENDIQGLLGSNSELSQEVAALKADMQKNQLARSEAQTLRDNENAAYLLEKADLEAAIAQLGKAVDALAAIGGDQALASAAHDKFMAGFDPEKNKTEVLLAGLSTSLNKAMIAAGSRMEPQKKGQFEVLLQRIKAPFTGTYVAQSGEVVGILKQMKATFESNLKESTSAENAAVSAHTKWSATKKSEWDTMDAASGKKSTQMGANDGDLSTKKQSLSSEKQSKESAIDFLDKLRPMCKDKAKDFEQRNMWRANEEAAISQAIAILNSDHAFDAFGKVNATSFLQVSSNPRKQTTTKSGSSVAIYLQQVARRQHSTRLARIAGMLLVGNPFERVLIEIAKVKKVLEEEGALDVKTRDWCNAERGRTQGSIDTKEQDILDLEGEITQLETDIDHPDTGLKAAIKEHEDKLEQYRTVMIEQTKERRKESQLNTESINDCVEAAAILQKASALLTKYYDQLSKQRKQYYDASFSQRDPAPPATWDSQYQGQSESSVIVLIETIRENTVTEEKSLHQTELEHQQDYEDLMQSIKDLEASEQTDLVTAKKNLATKQQELGEKRTDKENTQNEVTALNRYLEEIKPGCDFITDNFDTRKSNRDAETSALDVAVQKIQGTPAYQQMLVSEKEEGWGDCKKHCSVDENHVDCVACLNKVSVPGWCAGHASTPGCP